MNDDRDLVAELADRLQAKRGEELGIEFLIDFASLTDEEQDDFLALMDERAAHGEERLEAIEVQNRALKALLSLQVQRAPGMLWEALGRVHGPGGVSRCSAESDLLR